MFGVEICAYPGANWRPIAQSLPLAEALTRAKVETASDTTVEARVVPQPPAPVVDVRV